MLDDVVGVDDKGRAQCHTLGRIAHAKLIDQRTLGVAKAPVCELVQVLAVTPPAKLAEFVVGRAAQEHCIALFELAGELVEADDFGRAHEREVLGPEVNDLPLAGAAFLGDRLEGRNAVFLVVVEAGLDADNGERLDSLAYGFHGVPLRWVDLIELPAVR